MSRRVSGAVERRPSSLLLWTVLVVLAAPALAQREFVEEVEPNKPTNLADVDLDAPDAAAEKPATPPADAGPAAHEPAPATPSPAAGTPSSATPAPATAATPDPGAPAPGAPPSATPPPGTPSSGTPSSGTPSGAPSGAASALGSGDPFAGDGGVRVLETTYAAYLEKWDGREATVRRGEVGRARKQLADIDAALLDFGVQGIPGGFQSTAVATALVIEGHKALDDGDLESAGALLDAAAHAAPDLVAVHTAQALLRWREGDVGGTINAFGDAARAHFSDPLAISQVAARALAVLVALVVLALVLFALLRGLPSLRILSFDLLQVLPKGAHGGQVLALVVMAAVCPLVVGAGPVFGSLWILTLAWLYVSQRERVLLLVVALSCVAAPLAVDRVARLVAYPGSRADRAVRALFDADAEPLRTELAKSSPADLDVVEQAALGLAAKREGRLDDAVNRFEAIVAKDGSLPWAHAELGVIASLRGDEDTALAELGKAVAANPHEHAASFDISVLHYRAGRTDKAGSAVSPVAREAPDLLNAYRRTTFRAPDQTVGQNRALIDIYPSAHELLHEAMSQPTPESSAVADGIARLLFRGQTGTRAAGILGAFPLVWLALLAARKKIAPSQPCVRCGDPASSRVDGKDVPEDTCGQCFHAFVSTRSRIDAGVKLRKEREIIRRRTRLSRAILALGIVWPGAGHIFGEAPVRGLVFAVLHGAGLCCIGLALGLLPMPRLEGPWGHTPPLVAVSVVAGLVWLIALRSTVILAGDASGRGRR